MNNADEGACTLGCTAAVCGDGLVQVGVETCDDGNNVEGDGCEPDCTVKRKVVVILQRSCVLLKTGMVSCWGHAGALGTGDANSLGDDPGELPTPDIDLGGISVDIAASRGGFCALRDTGDVRCWGGNGYGQLGINSINDIGDGPGEMPPSDSKVGKQVISIAGGGDDTPSATMCAITTDGELRCWGSNGSGQLGLGHTNNLGDDPGELPSTATPVGFVPVQVSVGGRHVCARSAAGKVRCWGDGSFGQLGNGSTASLGDDPGELPVPDIALGGAVAEISCGNGHTCARMNDGAVRCWGRNDYGQLGIGSTQSIGDGPGEMPPANVALGGTIKSIASGNFHTCALRSDDSTVRCWGRNHRGQLGIGSTQSIGDGPGEMPPADAKLGGAALAVFAGASSNHAFAFLAGMQLRGWGQNDDGQLGLGHVAHIGDNELPSSAPFVPYE
ncbi:MAG: hypothetical protein IPK80_03310 [Nannocystis sp.]|nr:hypothetical protein [Nannocystis sp.]